MDEGSFYRVSDERVARKHRSDLRMAVVRGNHNKRAVELPRQLAVSYHDGPLYETPFAFTHYLERYDKFYNLAGHLHPAVKLTGAARQSARLPCFLFGPERGVLPALGGLTGKLTIRPAASEKVYVVADNQVLEVPAPV